MDRTTITGFLFCAVLLSFAFNAQAANDYMVSATIISKGEVLGTPSMLVTKGKKAVTRSGGDKGYELSLTVTSDNDNTAFAETRLTAAGRTIEPKLTIIVGEQSSVKDGELELKLKIEDRSESDSFMQP
ncbi:hypothetical protein [Gilvimarinus agarilyticus]|uniref:hypothetical protein n=1 Tax=Gilvimarinus agarilyticus TaxID=679259 RepID=UPI0005A06C8D|nr:hypothetical protein [Gilvimarinus agarilyticus]